MSVFLRYLASLLLHLMWSRAGKGGPLPPVRLPGKGPVNLPILGPWQMMAAMWLMNKLWDKYGREVKTHLMTTGHPAARGIGSWLPDPKNAKSGNSSAIYPATGAKVASAPATVTAPGAQPAPGAASGPSRGAALAYDTQQLSQRRLPSGSILSALRRPPSGSQTAKG